jgi:DNA polymerase-3 subunit epsilon
MSPGLRFALRLGAVSAVLAAVVAAIGVVVLAGPASEERALLLRTLEARAPALLFVGGLLLAVCGGALGWLSRRYVWPTRVLAEQIRLVLDANPDARIGAEGAPELGELAVEIGRLAAAYRGLLRDAEARAREAGARLEEERNRLAALMSELAEGVLVCNTEGRVLLYNEQARALFAAGSATEAAALVGLGRSIFGLIDRQQIAHVLEILRRQLRPGGAPPTTRFVTGTQAGRLLKVRAAPYVHTDGTVAGLVFALEDVTGLVDREARHRALLRAVTQAAAAAPTDAGGILADALREHADALRASLLLEDVRAVDLLGVIRHRLEPALGIPIEIEDAPEDLWLSADSFALVQVFGFLAGRLREDYQVRSLRLAARAAGGQVELDLVWSGALVASEALAMWELDPMQIGAESTPLTLRDVLQRHGGEATLQRSGAGGARESAFRLRLPAGVTAPRPARAAVPVGSRPEYYDFDLFRGGLLPPALHERRLADLAYTVFDTETTGLEPSAGDEIISIGAVRIVNGRLLRNEVYEQLVDPRRPLRPESARIHGIPSEALQGQPGIEQVLPVFRHFCEDTVLVAHNAAFDMRFLQMKEAVSSARFDAPVLDTLLLSALVHPGHGDHKLESIAARLGVSVIGRHTALGDALVTGEIFLKLVPLLSQLGIATLGEALEASRETYYARLKY